MESCFKELLSESIGPEAASRALDALGGQPSVSVRLNPSKSPEGGLPFEGEKVPWSPFGYFLAERPQFSLDPLFHAGAYYVQDSSAMFAGEVFRRILKEFRGQEVLRVLDLCAAPGGKSTDILSSLRQEREGGYFLISNEVSAPRASVLCENLARWGDEAVAVTSSDPSAFGKFPGSFDVILADVPCSGEGMFRKDEEALRQWSEGNVMLCQGRQRRILSAVWPALREGGFLIYSTCTFNHFENDDNVRWASETLGAEVCEIEADYEGLLRTSCGVSLVPGFVRGEGQYVALLRKPGGPSKGSGRTRAIKTEIKNVYLESEVAIVGKGGVFVALPPSSSALSPLLENLRPLRSGLAVGSLKGRDFVPHADLALAASLRDQAFPSHEAGLAQALAFLRRETLSLPGAPLGYMLIKYRGLGLGFVKNLGPRANNLLPPSRRLRIQSITIL